MNRTIVVSLLFAVVLFGCKRAEKPVSTTEEQKTATTAAPAQTATGTEVGSRMPEYSATNLDGSKFELAARRERVLLV